MPLVNILVTPANVSIPQGGTQQFTATGIDNKGQTSDLTATAGWSSTDDTVATVDATGLATGVGPGTAMIYAASQGVTGSTVVAVDVTLVSMAIAPADAVMDPGDQIQFTVTGTYSDASTEDLTAPAAWTTTNPAVATVDNTGLVTAITAGVAVIQANYGGLIAATSVGVTLPAEPLPEPPPVSPAEELLALAQRQLFLQVTGQAPLAIETPQLGRTVYQQASIADLRMLIDQLQALVYPEIAAATRRRPISVEACP